MSEDPDGESSWISRVMIHDDHDAFARLVELHQGAVRGFLRRLCRDDPERADDLSQETFWKAYRNISSFRGSGRFLSWLFGIAWQIHAGNQRAAGSRIQLLLGEDAVDVIDDSPDGIDMMAMEQLLERLRNEEQAAVLLHFRHGLTHAETAEALGIPLGTAKSLINRSQAKLRALAAGMNNGTEHD